MKLVLKYPGIWPQVTLTGLKSVFIFTEKSLTDESILLNTYNLKTCIAICKYNEQYISLQESTNLKELINVMCRTESSTNVKNWVVYVGIIIKIMYTSIEQF